jgi:hypothetical protein
MPKSNLVGSDDPIDTWLSRHALAVGPEAKGNMIHETAIAELREYVVEVQQITARQAVELNQMEVRLANCLVAALGQAPPDIDDKHYGWSLALERVNDLRHKYDNLTRTIVDAIGARAR